MKGWSPFEQRQPQQNTVAPAGTSNVKTNENKDKFFETTNKEIFIIPQEMHNLIDEEGNFRAGNYLQSKTDSIVDGVNYKHLASDDHDTVTTNKGGETTPFDKKGKKRKKSGKIRKTTKGKSRNFRTTKEGAGMTKAGVKKYKAKNPGSKLKTAVTGKVKPGSKAAGRRKSFCARSKGWTGERGKAARARWKC